MTTIDTIVNIPGNLLAYRELVPNTFYTARQLMDERCAPLDTLERRERRSEWHYTADGHGYSVDGDKVEWAITDEAHNLVLLNLDDAFTQLTATDNYRPSNEASLAARSAASTLRIDMSSLRLSGNESEWRYLTIETATGRIKSGEKYVALNETEKAVLERLGYTSENLAMLHEAQITETRVYVLNPASVKTEVAKDTEQRTSLWRASRLHHFGGDSDLCAGLRDVDYHSRLRGVRREVVSELVSAEGAAPETGAVPVAEPKIIAARCYDVLLADEINAAAALDPTRAEGLNRIIALYRASQE